MLKPVLQESPQSAAFIFGSFTVVPSTEENLDEHQRRADGDGRIGSVECRPVIRSQANLQKIGYAAMDQPVKRVACRPSENQRNSDLCQPSARAAREQQPN